jgi:hypothetical protein
VTTDTRDRDWLIPIAALAALEFLAAQALAFAIHYPGRPDAVGQFLFGAVIGLIMLAGFYAWQFAKLARRMTANPTRRLIDLTGERKARILAVAAGRLCISLHWITFNWMKSMLPSAVPFWADRPLADLDQALFGRAAWEWALSIVGPAAVVSKFAYSLWLPLHFIVLAGVLCMEPSVRKSRLLVAYFLMWMIGTAVSFAFSSGGPIFYKALGFGPRFHELLHQPHIGGIPKTAAYLWSNYQDHAARPGAGISAFPSMHVALAAWIAIALRHWSGWIFAALVFYGSFLLGWHYFLDAPAGIAVTLIGYFLAGRVAQLLAFGRLPNLRKAIPNSGVQVENSP